ncbi:MAG: type II toxin-antitoxin system prevent-host-death family antitoxin [Deltaproteobacteria bacterium]|nr:type II toxin-antitoxin system prevent-host-death family antitoxin [Deltaproteobacteria bacterium]
MLLFMKFGRKIPITEFKQKCLELVRGKSLEHSPIAITKHGRVIAIVSAPSLAAAEHSSLKGSVKYKTGDLVNVTFAEDWELK